MNCYIKYDIIDLTTTVVESIEQRCSIIERMFNQMKVHQSEWNVLEVLWDNGDLTAGAISKILKEKIGWSRNTTYTIINRCIKKGFIERIEPHFQCKPLISKQDVKCANANEIVEQQFGGSLSLFVSYFLKSRDLNSDEINELSKLVQDLKDDCDSDN